MSGIPFKNRPRASFIRGNYIYMAGYTVPDIYIVNTTTNTTITHTYSSAGTYTLKLRGMASRISFFNADAQSRLTGILSVVQGVGVI